MGQSRLTAATPWFNPDPQTRYGSLFLIWDKYKKKKPYKLTTDFRIVS
jgi:hypothetical protein